MYLLYYIVYLWKALLAVQYIDDIVTTEPWTTSMMCSEQQVEDECATATACSSHMSEVAREMDDLRRELREQRDKILESSGCKVYKQWREGSDIDSNNVKRYWKIIMIKL